MTSIAETSRSTLSPRRCRDSLWPSFSSTESLDLSFECNAFLLQLCDLFAIGKDRPRLGSQGGCCGHSGGFGGGSLARHDVKDDNRRAPQRHQLQYTWSGEALVDIARRVLRDLGLTEALATAFGKFGPTFGLAGTSTTGEALGTAFGKFFATFGSTETSIKREALGTALGKFLSTFGLTETSTT